MKTVTRKILAGTAAVIVIVGAAGAWMYRGNPTDRPSDVTTGRDPLLVEPEAERIPTIGVAKPVGWEKGAAPQAAKGLAVTRFAEGLDHPRTLLTLPNGDILVAETNSPTREGGGLTGFFMKLFMRRAGADMPSPNRIVLLRDTDGDGRAESRFDFRTKDLSSPSGMAWVDGKLYVANHDAILSFDFVPGATTLQGEPKKVMDLWPGGNHWMRNLLASPDGKHLYVAVGSASNIGEEGMQQEAGRASIWELDLATFRRRQYAGGMRNPNGMAWNPSTGELWAAVQERDMLGPDLVPDYLTNVPVGAQYGWPWFYWKTLQDWRVKDPIPDFLNEYTRKPEYAMGAHAAVLGLLFSIGGNLMGTGFANGAFVARHGSWNRKPLSGYDVVFVPFDDHGNPQGKMRPVLTGFLTGKDMETHGRPTWLAWDRTGGLLVSDDTAGVIWRVASPGAKPSAAPKAVVTEHMPPVRELKGDPQSRLEAGWKDDYAEVSK